METYGSKRLNMNILPGLNLQIFSHYSFQIEEGSFDMTFVGLGYSDALDDPEKEHESPPDQKIVTRVSGPGSNNNNSLMDIRNPKLIILMNIIHASLFMLINIHAHEYSCS